MVELKPRDVIKVFDSQMRAPNWKCLICVCERRRLFLRINTRPYWPPHVKIKLADCPGFLEWDSYVELRELVRVSATELRRALLQSDNPLGRLSDPVARQIAFAAQQASTISDDRRGIIWEGLVGGA
jgi:hypothetical protein